MFWGSCKFCKDENWGTYYFEPGKSYHVTIGVFFKNGQAHKECWEDLVIQRHGSESYKLKLEKI